MTDETPWPGPSWDFTIHRGGFPSHPVDGDLYENTFGLKYLCVRGQYSQITNEEWDELLDLKPALGEAPSAEFILDGRVTRVKLGEEITVVLRNGDRLLFRCYESKTGGLVLMPQAGIGGALIRPVGWNLRRGSR